MDWKLVVFTSVRVGNCLTFFIIGGTDIIVKVLLDVLFLENRIKASQLKSLSVKDVTLSTNPTLGSPLLKSGDPRLDEMVETRVNRR